MLVPLIVPIDTPLWMLAVAVAFGVAKVPETWIVDPNGFVRMRITGEISTDFLNETMSNFRLQASGGG